MHTPSTLYLLGNSSSSSITLDGSQFPYMSAVSIWNGTGYDRYYSDSGSSTGWVGYTGNEIPAPGIAVTRDSS